MVDRLVYSAVAASQQAKRDADAIASLKFLLKLGEISKQREQASRLLESSTVAPSLGSQNVLGASSQNPILGRPPLLPLTAPLATGVIAGTPKEVSPSLSSTLAPTRKIENLLLPRGSLQTPREAISSSAFMKHPLHNGGVIPSQQQQQPPLMAHHRLQGAPQNLSESGPSSSPSLHDDTATGVVSSIVTHIVPSSGSEGSLSTVSSEMIRAEKVQAALRSQHQRGKKRSDLSDSERLELTRTRNREHARSTRLRKKARHDELLKSEEQLKPLLRSKQLEQQRMQCLQSFFSARQDMLNSDIAPNDPVEDQECERLLSHVIVEAPDTFCFDTKGQLVSSGSEDSPFAVMRHWDERLRSRAMDLESPSPSPCEGRVSSTYFAYEIEDGIDGIAISSGGNVGYAQFDLILYKTTETSETSKTGDRSSTTTSYTKHRTVLLKGMLRVRFANDPSTPSKLSSAVCTILDDHCGLQQQAPGNATTPATSPFEALVAAAACK